MSTDLVIFDCDGVLVDSEPIANKILSQSLTRYGYPISPEDCQNLFLGGTMKSVAKTATAKGASLPANWLSEIYGEIYNRLRKGVPIVDGITDILDRLEKAGIRYCVASNGSIEKMTLTLGHTNLLTRFNERMFSAHEVGISKPDPGLFLFSAEGMKAEPRRTIVIEDSENGVMAAKNAKMKCFGYAPHDDGSSLAAHGASVFHKMSALVGLLEI